MARQLYELIKEYPELGEAFAEFENRVSAVENLLPSQRPEVPVISYQDTQWTNRQWDIVQQTRAEVMGWREKHALALKEIDKLKAKVDRGHKGVYTIE